MIYFYAAAATFVSFLLEVDSIYEVHDYIKSYLGETSEAHDFAKQFLERRQKLKSPNQQSQVSQLACLLSLVPRPLPVSNIARKKREAFSV